MAKVAQEFHCHRCGGFFIVMISVGYDRDVKIACPGPNCGRQHPRRIKDGLIFEPQGRNENATEEIIVPKSAYSKKPFTAKMKKAVEKAEYGPKRGGVKLETSDMAARDAQLASDAMKREIWLERYGSKLT